MAEPNPRKYLTVRVFLICFATYQITSIAYKLLRSCPAASSWKFWSY